MLDQVPLVLKVNERLAVVSPDHHSRRKEGKHWVYVVEDKLGRHLAISQSLPKLAQYVNAHIADKPDQLTVMSLFNILSVEDGTGRTGGWAKHRWRCRQIPIERAAGEFESLRERGFEHVVALGVRPFSYQVLRRCS